MGMAPISNGRGGALIRTQPMPHGGGGRVRHRVRIGIRGTVPMIGG